MTISHATDTREEAVRALLDLAALLPLTWEWRSVPVLRLAVWDGGAEGAAASGGTLVWVEGGWYVAEVEPDAEPERLAEVGHPGEAVELLARIVKASALVAARADLSVMGGAS